MVIPNTMLECGAIISEIRKHITAKEARMGPQNSDNGIPPLEPKPRNLVAQQAHILLVQSCAQEADLKLENFLTNDALELYYDVFRNRKSICYLSKGWDDPGFVIGNTLDLKKTHANFNENLDSISKVCSRHMLVQTVNKRAPEGCISISFEIDIYTDGFNEKVLKEAVKNMGEAMTELQSLLAADLDHSKNEGQTPTVAKNVAVRQANIALVEDCARASGFTSELPDGDGDDEKFELVRRICRGEKCICRVYKSWSSPGFSLVSSVDVTKNHARFLEIVGDISAICSRHKLAQDVFENTPQGYQTICFQAFVNNTDINKETFNAAATDLEAAKNEIEPIIQQANKALIERCAHEAGLELENAAYGSEYWTWSCRLTSKERKAFFLTLSWFGSDSYQDSDIMLLLVGDMRLKKKDNDFQKKLDSVAAIAAKYKLNMTTIDMSSDDIYPQEGNTEIQLETDTDSWRFSGEFFGKIVGNLMNASAEIQSLLSAG